MNQLPSFNQSQYPMARALYDCAAEDADELSFHAGQMVEILDMSNPEWWIGRANGVTGNLPRSGARRCSRRRSHHPPTLLAHRTATLCNLCKTKPAEENDEH